MTDKDKIELAKKTLTDIIHSRTYPDATIRAVIVVLEPIKKCLEELNKPSEIVDIIPAKILTLSEEVLGLTKDPNLVGEILRGKFFNQSGGRLGCYDTFELNKDVIKLPYGFDVELNVEIKNAKLEDVRMQYYWEHDGQLDFCFGDKMVSNYDCKKTSGWEWI